MLRLTRRRREVLVDRLPELANFAAGSLLFGQFLGEAPFSVGLAVVGLVVWVVLFATTFYLIE